MNTSPLPIVAITLGDVAGIGPEVVVRALDQLSVGCVCRIVLLGHPGVLESAARLVGVAMNFLNAGVIPQSRAELEQRLDECEAQRAVLCCNPCGDDVCAAPLRIVSALAGDAAFRYLDAAIDLALAGVVDAIVTAPLNKEALHLAGHIYPGHTEILAERCGIADFAMMLHLPESAIAPWRSMVTAAPPTLVQQQTTDTPPDSSGSATSARHGLSIAHVTLHTSIASVPTLLSVEAIADTVQLMHDFLNQIGCSRAKIAVAALNPHGGEHGLFGNEEHDVIQPAVVRCQQSSISVSGPLPIDTLIRRTVSGEFDGVVAMYHDQGHIPIKLIGFDRAVNITLGLPIIRTSPTHGTAFDRAWNPATPADATGLLEAIRTAIGMWQLR